MSDIASVKEAESVILKLWKKHGIKEPLKFIGFCLSLLPVPLIAQVGTAIERHLGDKGFEEKISTIWREICKLNQKLEKLESLEDSIFEIANTLNNNATLREHAKTFCEYLQSQESSFTLETTQSSYQELVNSIVKAYKVHISAQNKSINVIVGSTFQSSGAYLHASDGSKNLIDNTTFEGSSGKVVMQGISTTGNINVADSSIGFGENGSLIFGSTSTLVNGNCPSCNSLIKIDRHQLQGHQTIQCPYCKKVCNYSPNS